HKFELPRRIFETLLQGRLRVGFNPENERIVFFVSVAELECKLRLSHDAEPAYYYRPAVAAFFTILYKNLESLENVRAVYKALVTMMLNQKDGGWRRGLL